MSDASTAPAPARSRNAGIASTKIDAAAGTLTVTFSTGDTLTARYADLQHSPVPHLAVECALMGVGRELASAWNVKRKDPAAAFKAAQDRYSTLVTKGRFAREPAGSSMSALDVAIAVVAELKGRTVEDVARIVHGYTDSTGPDGKVITADDKRRMFVQRVKKDPQTAAAYAAKRTAPSKRAASEPSVLDQFE